DCGPSHAARSTSEAGARRRAALPHPPFARRQLTARTPLAPAPAAHASRLGPPAASRGSPGVATFTPRARAPCALRLSRGALGGCSPSRTGTILARGGPNGGGGRADALDPTEPDRRRHRRLGL